MSEPMVAWVRGAADDRVHIVIDAHLARGQAALCTALPRLVPVWDKRQNWYRAATREPLAALCPGCVQGLVGRLVPVVAPE